MMPKLLKNRKKIFIAIIFILLFFVLFNLSNIEYSFAADEESSFFGSSLNFISKTVMAPFIGALKIILDVLVWLIGQVSTLVIALLFVVADYNYFIKESIVIRGWVTVRDICNMFFVLILLVIAFSTILRIQSYEVKKALPKLIIMAILINFSKTICGLIIDFAQVVMLTFISPFGNNANFSLGHAGIVEAFHLDKMFSIANYSSGVWDYITNKDVTVVNTVATILFGFALVVIATIVIATFALILLYRVIILWILIILSPLAYLAASFPQGQKYSTQWWSEFTKNVIVGPVMAFFLWLALSISTGNKGNISGTIGLDADNLRSAAAGSEERSFSATLSQIGDVNTLLSYIMTAAFLIGGMMAAQQIGGAAGSMAGKGMAAIQSGKGLGLKLGKTGALWAGRKADKAQMWAQKGVFGKLAPKLGLGTGEYKPKSLNYRLIAKGFEKSRADDMEKYENLYGGGSLVWQDTFNKYARPSQYLGVRKSKKQQAKDNAEAERLRFENTKTQERVNNSKLSVSERIDKREDYKKRRKDIIKEYKNKTPTDLKTESEKQQWAEDQYKKDIKSVIHDGLNAWTLSDTDKAKENINKNEAQAEKLESEFRLGGKANLFGLAGGRSGYTHSASGDKEVVEKEQREMDRRTDGESSMVVTELLDAMKSRDATKTTAALRILAKNNDLNEALKDNRVISLMTKQNGILSNMAKTMKKEDGTVGLDEAEIDSMKQDFRSNPVTPAYAQALVKGLYDQLGVDENMSARYANDIGSLSIAGGNGLGYAMSSLDVNKGTFSFGDIKFKDGKAEITEEREGAIIGKLNNFESQAKMRSLHPDTLIKEGPDGSAMGIHEGGIAFLKSLTSHDIGQINRLRLDVVNKLGSSPAAMRQMKELAESLIKAGDQRRAKMVRMFAGYIKSKIEGSGIKDEKDYEDAFNTI